MLTALLAIRYGIFTLSVIFSIVVLGILANFTAMTNSNGFYYNAFALGIATSVMTLVFIVASLSIERIRRGAVVSLVWFELAWVALLWILWLATAASIASLDLFESCGWYNGSVESDCHQYQAAEAFAWIMWILMSGWWVGLLVLSIIASYNGHARIWRYPVDEHPALSKPASHLYGTGTTPVYTA